MDPIISYTRTVPLWKIIAGIAAVLIGLYGIVIQLDFILLVPLVLGLMLLKTEGSEINLESKTYRKTTSFLGVTFGTWKNFRNPEYISVFNTTEDITLRALSAETTNSTPIIVLNIFFKKNKKITVYKTKDVKDAFNVASHIADALLINLLNATAKGDYHWVDKDVLREQGTINRIDLE